MNTEIIQSFFQHLKYLKQKKLSLLQINHLKTCKEKGKSAKEKIKLSPTFPWTHLLETVQTNLPPTA